MNKGPLSQEILGYTYESARGRMKAHPEYAEKQKKIAKVINNLLAHFFFRVFKTEKDSAK